jgi:hypothetical protein
MRKVAEIYLFTIPYIETKWGRLHLGNAVPDPVRKTVLGQLAAKNPYLSA